MVSLAATSIPLQASTNAGLPIAFAHLNSEPDNLAINISPFPKPQAKSNRVESHFLLALGINQITLRIFHHFKNGIITSSTNNLGPVGIIPLMALTMKKHFFVLGIN